jgi:hypothetical protein
MRLKIHRQQVDPRSISSPATPASWIISTGRPIWRASVIISALVASAWR